MNADLKELLEAMRAAVESGNITPGTVDLDEEWTEEEARFVSWVWQTGRVAEA